MRVQNPEETEEERGITHYAPLRELIWSHWNDVFVSSQKKEGQEGWAEMTSEAFTLRWWTQGRVGAISDHCASVHFKTSTRGVHIIIYSKRSKAWLMIAQSDNAPLTVYFLFLLAAHDRKMTHTNKQSLVAIFGIFSRFSYKLGSRQLGACFCLPEAHSFLCTAQTA